MRKMGTISKKRRKLADKAPKSGASKATVKPFGAESLKFYRYLIDNIADAIVVNAGPKRVFVNSAYLKLQGLSSIKEALGQSSSESVLPEDLPIIEKQNRSRPRGKPMPSVYEFRLRRRNGEIRNVEVSSVQITWDGIPASIEILRDITGRRKQEDSIKAMESTLRQAQKMEAVGRLAGGIAHDFNNMLTPIMGFAELGLEELKPNDPAAVYFSEIITAATNARDLTRQLMSFTQKKGLQLIFNLNDLISQAMPIIESVAGETVKVSTSLAPNAWTVKADPAEVQQVIINLIVNAKDAMPDGGNLSITTTNQTMAAPLPKNLIGLTPGSYVVLSVTDTGRGMSENLMSHLFEPFFTTKKEGHGVGLSLATSFAIAKLYGGTITAESKPGAGTTMKVFLPKSLTTDGPSMVNVGQAPRGTESVLLVEDDASVRRITAQMLTRLGYKATVADNGKDALSILRRRGARFEVVLTDFIMPGMSGKRLAEQVNKLHAGTKVIYMSGYVGNATTSEELAAEGARVLRKPFGLQALALKMREVLGK